MTILGQYSAAELQDLVKAKDFENAKMQASYDALGLVVKASDDGVAWKKEWDDYLLRYGKARKEAALTIAAAQASQAPMGFIPVQPVFVQVLNAETRPNAGGAFLGSAAEGPYKRGDKQDLYNRLTRLVGTPAKPQQVDFTGLPQPRPGTDTDLNVFKSADSFTKSFEDKVSPAKNPWPYVAGGAALLFLGVIALKK
jgi:hypothetical protein